VTSKPEKPRQILIYGRWMTVDYSSGVPKVNWGQLFDGHYHGVSDAGGKIGEGRDHLVEASSVWWR